MRLEHCETHGRKKPKVSLEIWRGPLRPDQEAPVKDDSHPESKKEPWGNLRRGVYMFFNRSHPSTWVQMICTWTKDLLTFLSSE